MRPDRVVLPLPPIRPGRDEDGPALIALIERCWADYPGLVLDVDGEEPHLRALATHFARQGGAVWWAGDGAGLAAVRPAADGAWEICKLYVHPDLHGSGLGHALLDVAEGHAADAGAVSFELWSDTRFLRAHRFYEKRGYRRGLRRALHDQSNSEEWQFVSPVGTCRNRP